MIVRRLKKDENGILDALQSLAFSFSCDTEKSGELDEEVYGAFLDDDRTLTAAIITGDGDCTEQFDAGLDAYETVKYRFVEYCASEVGYGLPAPSL